MADGPSTRTRLGVTALAVIVVLAASLAVTLYPFQQQTPRIGPSQKAAQGVSGEQQTWQRSEAQKNLSGQIQEAASSEHAENREIFGVKPGEWLLFFATLALWWATMRLVKGADKTAEKQLRAYICKIKSEVRNFKIGENPNVHVVFKNEGLTPAHNVVTQYGVAFLPFASASQPKNPTIPDRAEPHSRSVTGPDGEIHLNRHVKWILTREKFEALEKGTHAIHAIGFVKYRDVFGHNRETKFSVYYGGGRRLNANGVMGHTAEGNEAT